MLPHLSDKNDAAPESGAKRDDSPTMNAPSGMILVSACLLGIPCRFDGQGCLREAVLDLAAQGRVVPVCPEVAGGLAIPRLPAEIEGAHLGLDGKDVLAGKTRVIRCDGVDVSTQFVAGAEMALAVARRLGIQQAILKTNSPSCGAGRIHEGKFEGNLVAGDGVAAALLRGAGILVTTEENVASARGGNG